MGRFYDESLIPAELRRGYDVYDRIRDLGIDLGTLETNVSSLAGRNIADVILHESGLVWLSGAGLGELPMNDDPDRVAYGQHAGQVAADVHIRWLHWALTCGGEGGDLNDVLYTVKVLGMVVSEDLEFKSAPEVVNGYSARWQSVFGGDIGAFVGRDGDGEVYGGVHARSAVGGFAGQFFSLEPEIIVAVPPPLARAIIGNRGWLFPLPPTIHARVLAAARARKGDGGTSERVL